MKKNLRNFALFLALGLLLATAMNIFSKDKKGVVNRMREEEALEEEEKEDLLRDTTKNIGGKETLVDPDNILVLVNKERFLPEDYEPEDLMVAQDVDFAFKEDIDKRYLREPAAEALSLLFKEARKEGLELYAQSGYRSYKRQETIFNNKVEKDGLEEAQRLVALPGTSEHQTGLCMDLTSRQVGFDVVEEFEDTPEGQWIKDQAHRFGFIIRYPKDGEEITGYSYEPWHIRFVGREAAQEIYEGGLTLEEYLGFK